MQFAAESKLDPEIGIFISMSLDALVFYGTWVFLPKDVTDAADLEFIQTKNSLF